MSRDYEAVERELLDDLEARTGRDLAAWMTAIDGCGTADRNARIDWLRAAGLSFANASWLERIHHNGGKPIYVGRKPAERRPDRPAPGPHPRPAADIPPADLASAERDTGAEAPREQAPTTPQRSAAPPEPPAVAPAPTQAGPDLAPVLARAKAYRLLAEMLITETRRAVPDVRFGSDGETVTFATATGVFALLHPTPRELRLALALDLGAAPLAAPWTKSRIPGAPPHLTHMAVLTDARQIDAALLARISAARDRHR